MENEYINKEVHIFNEDCLEGMKRISDKSIDMILTDLPYGQTSHEWDKKINLDELWKQYNRIIKENGVVALFAKGKFFHEIVGSNFKNYRYEWVWNKKKGSNFAHVKRMPLNTHEYIVVFYKRQPTYNPQMVDGKPYKQYRKSDSTIGIADNMDRSNLTISDGKRYPKSLIDVEGIAQRNIVVPTQKPVALIEYLIRTYTNEGDTVLDSCMGSGTTGVACLNTDRKFIGFEKDKEHFKIAKERIDEIINE